MHSRARSTAQRLTEYMTWPRLAILDLDPHSVKLFSSAFIDGVAAEDPDKMSCSSRGWLKGVYGATSQATDLVCGFGTLHSVNAPLLVRFMPCIGRFRSVDSTDQCLTCLPAARLRSGVCVSQRTPQSHFHARPPHGFGHFAKTRA